MCSHRHTYEYTHRNTTFNETILDWVKEEENVWRNEGDRSMSLLCDYILFINIFSSSSCSHSFHHSDTYMTHWIDNSQTFTFIAHEEKKTLVNPREWGEQRTTSLSTAAVKVKEEKKTRWRMTINNSERVLASLNKEMQLYYFIWHKCITKSNIQNNCTAISYYMIS